MRIPRVPTFFPEARLYFTRRIHSGLGRYQHLPFGALLYDEYGAEAERLERVVQRRRGARTVPRDYRRDQEPLPEDDDEYEAVCDNNIAQLQPIEEQFRYLDVEDPANSPQVEGQQDLPEGYTNYQAMNVQGPPQSQPLQEQFDRRGVEDPGYRPQPERQQQRRRGIRAFIAERALCVLEERYGPNFRLPDPPPERRRNRLSRDAAPEQQLERTRSAPHRRSRTREQERQSSSRRPRRTRDTPNGQLSRSRTVPIGRRVAGRAWYAHPPADARSGRTAPGTHQDFANEVPMMSGALQSGDNPFVNPHFATPNDELGYGEEPGEEIYPDDSASRAPTPEPASVHRVPSVLHQPNRNTHEERDLRRDTAVAVVDGDITQTEIPHPTHDQQAWSWGGPPGGVAMPTPPSARQPRRTDLPGVAGAVTIPTDDALARYGGLQLTTEQQRQKERRERMMRSAQFMEKGKEKDVK